MARTKDLTINLQLQNKQLLDALKKTNKRFDESQKSQTRLTRGVVALRTGYLALAAILGGVVVRTIGNFIKKASDAEEITSKFNVVFSKLGREATQAAKDLANGFGLTNIQAKKLLGNTGDLLTGFGFTQEAALDLSTKIASLGADLASFTNLEGGAEEASKRLTSALTGETEGLKALGIVVRQDTKQFQDRVKAIQESEGVTVQQAKSLAILEQATIQSKNAIGDFQRTQEGTANQIRIFKNNVEDLIIAVGQRLLPAFNGMLQFFNKLLNSADPATAAIQNLKDAQLGVAKAEMELQKADNSKDRAKASRLLSVAKGKESIAILKLRGQQILLNKAIDLGTKSLDRNKAEIEELEAARERQKKRIEELIALAETGQKRLKNSRTTIANAIILATTRMEEADKRLNEITKEGEDLEEKRNNKRLVSLALSKQEIENGKLEAEQLVLKNEQKEKENMLLEENNKEKQASVEKTAVTQEEILTILRASNEERKMLIENLAQKTIETEDQITAKVLEEQQKRKEAALEIAQSTSDLIQTGFDVFTAVQDNKIRQIEAEKKAVQQKNRDGLISDEDYAKRVEELDRKKAEQLTKRFRADKIAKILKVQADTALGISNVWSQWGSYPIVAGVLSGIVGSIGAANTGIIAAQKPPAFQTGGVIRDVAPANVPGEDGIIAVRRGESVLNQQVTAELGEDAIDRLNAGGGIQPSITINVANGEGAVDTLNDYFRQFGGGRELATG
jgi:hypothetical protein